MVGLRELSLSDIWSGADLSVLEAPAVGVPRLALCSLALSRAPG